MHIRDLFLDTVQTLWAHKLRTGLTMFGIAWGIFSIVLMVAAGEGLRVGQQKVSQQFGRDLMIVFAGRTSLQAGGLRAGRQVHWNYSDLPIVQEQSPDCRYVPAGDRQQRTHSQQLQRGPAAGFRFLSGVCGNPQPGCGTGPLL